MSILGKVLGGLAEPVVNYLNRRQEIKAEDRKQERALKQAINDRQVDLIKQGLAADMQWETQMAEQAGSSWKDEYVLVVLSIPAIAVFIPGVTEYIKQGFLALGDTPRWYQLMLISVFLATYGIRFWRRSQYDTE